MENPERRLPRKKDAPSKKKAQAPAGGANKRKASEETVDFVRGAIGKIQLIFSAINTKILVDADGLHVRIDVLDRETGEPVTLDLCWELSPFFVSRDHVIDWTYACVREAWVHELNEAFFVDGERRRDLHDDRGRAISPDDSPADRDPAPLPMILHCPWCGERHVDRGAFATKVHHTHACQACGHVWRPAVNPTVGVQFLPGFRDTDDD